MATGDDTFDRIDWSEESGSGRGIPVRTVGFLLSVAGIGAAFAYDYTTVEEGEPLLLEWDVTGIDWLFLVSLAVIGFYLVYPLARNPGLARYYWDRLRESRRAVASLAYLAVFYLVGSFGPAALDLLERTTGITGARSPYGVTPVQPPWGVSASLSATGNLCVGRTVAGACHGTMYHPLGTDDVGRDVLVLVVEGAQAAMQVSTTVAVLAAPIGIAVGTAAAHYGGRVDEVLMRYVDLQLVVPPFFVYLFLQVVVGRGFVLMVAVFGLLNWGTIARLVRSEALGKADLGYIRAAEDAGSSPFRTIRRHVVPNVSNTVITSVTLMLPTVILIEATLAFLQLSSPSIVSWGNQLSGAHLLGAGTVTVDGFDPDRWWMEAFPGIALALTVLAFSVLGDALRDVLDPKTEVKR